MVAMEGAATVGATEEEVKAVVMGEGGTVEARVVVAREGASGHQMLELLPCARGCQPQVRRGKHSDPLMG